MQWLPVHLETELNDDSIIEGWLKAKVRSRRVAVHTDYAENTNGLLSHGMWEEEAELKLRGAMSLLRTRQVFAIATISRSFLNSFSGSSWRA